MSKLLKLDLQTFATVNNNRVEEIQLRKKELLLKSDISNDANELRSISTELDTLNQELKGLKTETRSTPEGQLNVLGTYVMGQANTQETERSTISNLENLEQRAAQFERGKSVKFSMEEAEIRSISITGGSVALQTHSSGRINPTFNEVSSLVDLVKSIPLPGGESYKSGFVVSSGSADYSLEGADYHDNEDVKTDFVKIDKAKITTYFELPEEVQKLGGNHYMTFALEAARTAIRKKIAEQIVAGNGGSNALQGIFKAPTNVIPTATDLEVSAVTSETLDQIIFNHGGDESVEGGAYLILNKQTLALFSKQRATDGKRLYRIKLDQNGNVGTISSEDSFEVPFIINSAVKSFADAAEGEYFLAYGKPMSYEMPLFSGLEVEESRHVKFKSGQIAVKASVFAGGNTASYKGFTRVKKVAAV